MSGSMSGEQGKAEQTLADVIQVVESAIGKIPVPLLRKEVAAKLAEMRKLLVERRSPRVALIGRRGAGKSSLVNALFGEDIATLGHVKAETMENKWRTLHGENGELELLDTRGLQEGTDDFRGADVQQDPALASLQAAFRETPPDVVLFVVKAKEVDAGIDGDLARLQQLLEVLRTLGVTEVPVVGVVTQCDELEPPDVRLHAPEDNDEEEFRDKVDRVKKAADLVAQRLQSLKGVHVVTVLGTSAYMRWKADGRLAVDMRWNMDALQSVLFQELPMSAVYEFVKLARVKRLKLQVARSIVHAFSVVAAGIGAMPMPIADTIPLMGMQSFMVLTIAKLDSSLNTMKDVGKFIGMLGLSYALGYSAREVARMLVQLVPVLGVGVSAAVAYAGTRSIGTGAIRFFLQGESEEEVRRKMKEDLTRFRKEAEEDPVLRQGTPV